LASYGLRRCWAAISLGYQAAGGQGLPVLTKKHGSVHGETLDQPNAARVNASYALSFLLFSREAYATPQGLNLNSSPLRCGPAH